MARALKAPKAPKAFFIPPDKQGFLLSVYGVLIVELIVTFFVVYYFRKDPALSKVTKQSMLFYLISTLGLVLILSFVPMPIWLKFIVFTGLSALIGGMLHQTSSLVSETLINQALTGTIAVFVGMSFIALVLASMGIDLGWMGAILLAALLGLIVASLVVMFFFSKPEDKEKNKGIHKTLLIVGLILFAIYVMYETNIIVQKDYDEDVVSAALGLYLDFVNIFSRLLGLETSD